MKSGKSRGASYIWEGIWEAKEAMKGGFRWVLGDGKVIDACRDPWLRAKNNYRVEDMEYSADIAQCKVSELFIQGTKAWDVEKITRTFVQSDVAVILATRIPQNSTTDRLAWVQSADGQYSVKTGYKFWHAQNIGNYLFLIS